MAPTSVPPSTIAPTVFQQVLRAPFFNLPDSLRALHSIRGRGEYAGQVSIERGSNPLARLCGAIAGLPPAMTGAPTTKETDVAEGVWRAVNDTTGTLRFPAGADAVALARAA